MTLCEPTPAPTLGGARAQLRARFGDGDSSGDVLLCEALGCTREFLYASPDTRLTGAQRRRLDALVGRRLRGEPLAYLVGCKEFYSLEFAVTPATLIPRPETETLVEAALACAPGRRRPLSVLDLGTGCGAVAVTLAVLWSREAKPHRIVATDVSDEALAVAAHNARRHRVDVELVRSDWFENLSGRTFDLVVSNPPYVAADDPELAPEVGQYEPDAALIAGPRGDECLERIICEAPAYMREGARLVVEYGAGQAGRVSDLMRRAGFGEIRQIADFSGRLRVCVAPRPARSGVGV